MHVRPVATGGVTLYIVFHPSKFRPPPPHLVGWLRACTCLFFVSSCCICKLIMFTSYISSYLHDETFSVPYLPPGEGMSEANLGLGFVFFWEVHRSRSLRFYYSTHTTFYLYNIYMYIYIYNVNSVSALKSGGPLLWVGFKHYIVTIDLAPSS